jgi:hypothetical protein
MPESHIIKAFVMANTEWAVRIAMIRGNSKGEI